MRVKHQIMTHLSPLPTLESWANFCKRFRQAIAGGCTTPKTKLTLDPQGKLQADHFFQELCFAREGTPHKHTCKDDFDLGDNGDDDLFVDALSVEGDV